MSLYTGKGDAGTTKTLNSKERFSKSAPVTEALGTVDELNSFLGLCKTQSDYTVVSINDEKREFARILERVQKDLFIIQAELAGAEKTIAEEKIGWMEEIVDGIEKQLPPITSFLVPGKSELGAYFDVARTIARRAERRVIAAHDSGTNVGEHTLAYVNRLSSLLYAFARFANYLAGGNEPQPDYR